MKGRSHVWGQVARLRTDRCMYIHIHEWACMSAAPKTPRGIILNTAISTASHNHIDNMASRGSILPSRKDLKDFMIVTYLAKWISALLKKNTENPSVYYIAWWKPGIFFTPFFTKPTMEIMDFETGNSSLLQENLKVMKEVDRKGLIKGQRQSQGFLKCIKSMQLCCCCGYRK